VQRLATAINKVLTRTYIDIYGLKNHGEAEHSLQGDKDTLSGSPAIEMVTLSSPLASSEAVLALVAGGLADVLIAAPIALQSLGLNQSDINEYMKRVEQKEDAEKKREEEDRQAMIESRQMALQSQKISLTDGGPSGSSSPPKSVHPEEAVPTTKDGDK
jgi:hypothetical protein